MSSRGESGRGGAVYEAEGWTGNPETRSDCAASVAEPAPVAGAAFAFPCLTMTSVVIIVADGARPDSLHAAMDDGSLPALAQLRAEGHSHVVSSVFPSVTGPAYTPFLLGRHPAAVGLPGLRWFDRSRRVGAWPHRARSYVGWEMRHVDSDLDPRAPTLFELAQPSLGALNVIGRGLPPGGAIGRGPGFVARAARTHFTGNVRGWLGMDREVSELLVRRVLRERPRVTFAALTGIDKTSHAEGHDAAVVLEAMRIVDDTVAALREGLERNGRWQDTRLWVVSDHGHSPVSSHDDLERWVRSLGFSVMAHPWVHRPASDVAVMVSGNAMAHLYMELGHRERQGWPALRSRWGAFAEEVLQRESVDLMLLPHDERRCEIRSGDRGSALVISDGSRLAYRPETGDPLGIGEIAPTCADAAYEACLTSDYPDALLQVASLARSERCGDMVLSASRGHDFRARYEPIPHHSAHGALHAEHMLVPLIGNHPVGGSPLRTVDVFSSAVRHLDVDLPAMAEGASFL